MGYAAAARSPATPNTQNRHSRQLVSAAYTPTGASSTKQFGFTCIATTASAPARKYRTAAHIPRQRPPPTSTPHHRQILRAPPPPPPLPSNCTALLLPTGTSNTVEILAIASPITNPRGIPVMIPYRTGISSGTS